MMPRPALDGARAATARTLAQAKVNLFLRVLAREDSGYHQLETLFCRLDLGDDVVVHVDGRGRSLDVTGGVVPLDGLGPVERNLAWRAADAYSARTGWPNAWAIEIVKRIPVGGGLGGGSADAGAVLRCLNALAPEPLDARALLDVAGTLGADVPVVTIDAPRALAWGRGDRLLPLRPLPARDVALACFPFGVPTPDAFRWLDEATAGAVNASALDEATLADWSGIAMMAHNDFEPVVAARFPQIAGVLSTWRTLASGVAPSLTLLSGSGATVFHIADGLPNGIATGLDPSVMVVRTRTANRVVGVELAD
jgi:4-diphosphocytidyl-2-C-methyl-D-erythritol kinase